MPRELHVHFDFLPEEVAIPGSEPTLISSQWFLNPFTVQEKLAANDYEVMVSPVFFVEGAAYRVIMDGHHSFRAAMLAGIAPVLIESESWHGINKHIANGDPLGGLRHQFQKMGPYFKAATKELVWLPGSPYFMEA